MVKETLVEQAVAADLRRHEARYREVNAHLRNAGRRRHAVIDLLRVRTDLAEAKFTGYRLQLMKGGQVVRSVDCTTHGAALRQWMRFIRMIELAGHRAARRQQPGAPDHLFVISWINRWHGAIDGGRTQRVATTDLAGLRIEAQAIG